MSPTQQSIDEVIEAHLVWQVFQLTGDPSHIHSALLKHQKTGALTVHFKHGYPKAYEWREPAPNSK